MIVETTDFEVIPPFRRKISRRARLALFGAAALIVGAGTGVYAHHRHASPNAKTSNSSSSSSSGVAAVEDPATLVPMTLSAPTPLADEIFGTRLMNFSIALDRIRRDGVSPNLVASEDALAREDVRTGLGQDVFDELQNVKRVARECAKAPPADHPSVDALDVAVAKLDNALLRNKLPYFVDVSVLANSDHKTHKLERIILFYEFSVAESGLFANHENGHDRSHDNRVRSVRVRRLDHLNWSHTSLGFVNPHRAQATVLLDQVDDQLVRHLLPALAQGAPMPLVPVDRKAGAVVVAAPTSPAFALMSARAGENAREELGRLPSVDQVVVRDLGDKLVARRELFEKWNGHGQDLGLGVRVPTGLRLDMNSFENELGDRIEPSDMSSLREIQTRLQDPEISSTYTAVRDAFADSIERHEVQHRLDILDPIPMPKAVLPFIQGDSETANDLRDAIKNELSAYVAQIARDDHSMAKTTLALLQRFLVNQRTRTSTEAYVAIIATEEIARVLGINHEIEIDDVVPLVKSGRAVDEDRLARAHEKLTSVSSERLGSAARTAWKNLFGRDLAPLSRIK